MFLGFGRSSVLLGGAVGLRLARKLDVKILDFKIVEQLEDSVVAVEVVVD
jgi:hypothetical protein